MNKLKFSLLAASVAMGVFGVNAYALASTVAQDTKIESAVSSQEAIFELMRDRWSSYFLGNPDMAMSEDVKSMIVKTNKSAKTLLSTLKVDKTGLWEDIPLNVDSESGRLKLGVDLYKTYGRIDTLVRAYKLEGGELQGNKELLATIVQSLDMLNKEYYRSGAPEWGNWWHWELGISRTVNNMLVMLYDDVPRELIDNYIDATRYFVPKTTHLSVGFGAPYSSNSYIWESTGGNRTDNAQVVLLRGLLDRDPEEITNAIASLSDVVEYVETGDGFYKDGSYLLHKDLPYSGTYGQVMLEGLGMLLGLVANTPYAPTDPNITNIYPLMMKTFAPILVDGKAMDFVNGRSVTRANAQNDTAGQLVTSSMMLYIDSAPEEYKTKLQSFIKGELVKTGGKAGSRILSNQIAEQLINSDVHVNLDNVAHYQFAEMDRVIHHRNSWTFGVSMHSDRVGNYECINGENMKGWHTADGMTYLYNDQAHYKDYWPVVDPYKHAGTTTLQRDLELCSGQVSAQRGGRKSSMDWTGGTKLGAYGVSGMYFEDPTNSLSLHKSWFMFDNEIVALGSDIDNSSSDLALTTIENRKVDDNAVVKVNGNVVTKTFTGDVNHLSISYDANKNSIQYINLGGAPVKVETVCRTADWAEVGSSKGEVSGCFIEATIDQTTENHYSYAVIPDSETTTEFPVEVLENNDTVHAVYHKELGIFAANFWDDGKAGIVNSDSPMSIMTQKDGDLLKVSVSNPTRSWFDTSFALDGTYELVADDQKRVELTDGNSLSVDLGDLDGSGYTFTLKQIK